MACFLVPATEAIVTTVITKVVKSRGTDRDVPNVSSGEAPAPVSCPRMPFSRKLKWLSNLLWGGSALLAFEHVWHGEVVPWFPFLTAAGDPKDAAVMLHEMSTVGVSMAILVTAVWLGMVLATSSMEKKALKSQSISN